MRIDRHILRYLCIAIVAATLLSPAAAARAEMTSVVTQLGWLRIGEYAPILVAAAKDQPMPSDNAHWPITATCLFACLGDCPWVF